MSGDTTDLLNRRDQALLHAVAEDRCEIVPSAQPALFVDGRLCSDGDAGRRLISAGLVAQPGLGTGRWPARLTEVGEAELARTERDSGRI
ncbi:MAG: hypothetical protein QOI50_1918 [Pseudonocardiales bacterium]|jgi:hypothetical protein|nr:hypothetical protein [Pseudonocardiales bacterium]MDT7566152.1 hypothetical protein [Pseudonocardiales bacterium]MDT7629988.1 hypothetical protein [Pseudonocardiales bacterium]MDT7691629.1 hypothetical protein [Pseudonocardiales bacterium]